MTSITIAPGFASLFWRVGDGRCAPRCTARSLQLLQSRKLLHVSNHTVGDQTDHVPNVSFIAHALFLHAQTMAHGAMQCLSTTARTETQQLTEKFREAAR